MTIKRTFSIIASPPTSGFSAAKVAIIIYAYKSSSPFLHSPVS